MLRKFMPRIFAENFYHESENTFGIQNHHDRYGPS